MPNHTFREQELIEILILAFELLPNSQIVKIYSRYSPNVQIVVKRIIDQIDKYELAYTTCLVAEEMAKVVKRNAIDANLEAFLTSVAYLTI